MFYNFLFSVLLSNDSKIDLMVFLKDFFYDVNLPKNHQTTNTACQISQHAKSFIYGRRREKACLLGLPTTKALVRAVLPAPFLSPIAKNYI